MPIYVSVSILQISSPSAVLWDPSRWSRQACIRSRWSMSGKSLLGDVDGDFPRFFSSLSFFPSRFLSRSSFFKSHGVRLSLFVHSIWFYTRRPLDVKCNRYYFPISTRELCRLFFIIIFRARSLTVLYLKHLRLSRCYLLFTRLCVSCTSSS